ncbi:glutamate racemase [Pseudomonas vancouverensis]|uniref:Glutamate racemase n=1 Tax=Pseudomonas vancouverensis TaxID=95300 RepID=A0A1H2MIV0_PSEVA|nr:aspartate/glutamate racemase family protein [Pseudomonas vancouverensis]KAB0489330.1 glutamate racemase [Pseudomonas vancouverensis]TDB56400.1 glutamate racemase [Pseudomonas vancouverensis]SDU92945.1 glutamate racemase [Pseudomonas vancouverensis]
MGAIESILSDVPNLWLGNGSRFDGAKIFQSRRPIVVLDSGVGGLTVVRELEKLVKNADILYVADNDWFPYGSRGGTEIARRMEKLLEKICMEVTPSAIVIACNTASVAIMDRGIEKIRHNCFLVTPKISEAVEISKRKNIVILATAGTLKSRQVLLDIARGRMIARIWPIAAQSLVALSEAKLAGEDSKEEDFARLINLSLSEKQRLSVDTVVLGCTHFPHLIDDLRWLFPTVENWIDPASEVAQRVVASGRMVGSVGEVLKVSTFTSNCNAAKYFQVFQISGFGLISSSLV